MDGTVSRGDRKCFHVDWQTWRRRQATSQSTHSHPHFCSSGSGVFRRIEGTQSTLAELLAAEADAAVERSPEDLREVGNYVVALEYGTGRLKTLPLSLRFVRELHEKLMSGVRGQHATPGEFRRSQNWIGPSGATLAQASYVPSPPVSLGEHLSTWENFLHDRMLPPLVHAALMDYQFEAIHPFLDGNGRVGRLLITIELCERNLLPAPFLYLSAFFDTTRSEYYGGLRAVTEEGDWGRWLQYFLNGVARQAEDALGRAEQTNKLLEQWRQKLASDAHAKVAFQMLELLGGNPFLTPRGAKQRLDLAYNTVMRAIEQLERRGIVKEVSGAKRDRVYCAKRLLQIFEAPHNSDLQGVLKDHLKTSIKQKQRASSTTCGKTCSKQRCQQR